MLVHNISPPTSPPGPFAGPCCFSDLFSNREKQALTQGSGADLGSGLLPITQGSGRGAGAPHAEGAHPAWVLLEDGTGGLASLRRSHARGEAGICLPRRHSSLAAGAADTLPLRLGGHSHMLERACLAKYQLAAIFANDALKFL